MRVRDYLKHITVEDLVEKGFLSEDNVIKNEYGYFIMEGCCASISEKYNTVFLPASGRLFSMIICSSTEDCMCESNIMRNFDSEYLYSSENETEAKDDFEDIKDRLRTTKDYFESTIVEFVLHLPNYSTFDTRSIIRELVKKFEIDIPAEVIKEAFLYNDF